MVLEVGLAAGLRVLEAAAVGEIISLGNLQPNIRVVFGHASTESV